MSKAVSRLRCDSATTRTVPSAVIAIPFGKASPSATVVAVPSGRMSATNPAGGSGGWPDRGS